MYESIFMIDRIVDYHVNDDDQTFDHSKTFIKLSNYEYSLLE